MKNSIFSLTIIATVCSAAAVTAADLSSIKSAPSVFPTPTWTGFYTGLNLGSGWGADNNYSKTLNFDGLNGGVTDNLTARGAGSGVGGGAQIGYNRSITSLFLIGGEVDFQGASILSGSEPSPGPLLNLNNGAVRYVPGWVGGGVNISWFGTFRGRAGLTLTPTLLVYGAGGFAYADVESAHGGYWSGQSSSTRTGWTAGGGLEWMFMPNWSTRAEYLYTDLSGGDEGLGNGLGLNNGSNHTRWNAIRVGVNHHYTWGDVPVTESVDLESKASTSIVPKSALSVGVGGSLNLTTFGQQHIWWAGTSNDYDRNGRLFGSGFAQWGTNINLTPQLKVAPIGQLNYFNHFGDGDFVWGSKFNYSYLDSGSSQSNVLIPQFGLFNVSVEGKNAGYTREQSFYGTGYLQSYQSKLNHLMALTPYIGRSFSNGFVYAGAGPTLSQYQTNFNKLTGYRSSGGEPVNQTTLPTNYQSSQWVLGGSATAGITYFITRCWYVDLNYTFYQTRSATNRYLGWYAAPVPGTQITSVGYLPASSSTALNSQSFNISLNWAFDMN
jgi:outer membrane immunogenic protein